MEINPLKIPAMKGSVKLAGEEEKENEEKKNALENEANKVRLQSLIKNEDNW